MSLVCESSENCPVSIPVTSEYVFTVLDSQCASIEEAYCGQRIANEWTWDTKLDTWRMCIDGGAWKDIAASMQWQWLTTYSDDEWDQFFNESAERTVGDLCTFIAATGSRPRVRSVTVCGKKCVPAGIFLAIRDALEARGEDVSGLRPSTNIVEYATTCTMRGCVLGVYVLLSPRSMPSLTIEEPLSRLRWLYVVCALVPLAVAGIVSLTAGVATLIGSILAIYVCEQAISSTEYMEYVGVTSFSDLCRYCASSMMRSEDTIIKYS